MLAAAGLGKQHGRHWALRGCSLRVPAGRVTALVGPNGAGKSTLLHLAAGLTCSTEGSISVLGGLRPGSPAALPGVGFVAQDAPLYPNLTVGGTLTLAACLNSGWDADGAAARMNALGIPPRRRVRALSGGAKAQLALAIALAKRPALLILDEPLARLDPLARHEFIAHLMTAVAERRMSVILSSHVLAELEPIADHLIVLNRGRVQVAGDVDDLLDGHRVLAGPLAGMAGLAPVWVSGQGGRVHALVRACERDPVPDGFVASRPGLAELVLGYLREPSASALPGPAVLSGAGLPGTGPSGGGPSGAARANPSDGGAL